MKKVIDDQDGISEISDVCVKSCDIKLFLVSERLCPLDCVNSDKL